MGFNLLHNRRIALFRSETPRHDGSRRSRAAGKTGVERALRAVLAAALVALASGCAIPAHQARTEARLEAIEQDSYEHSDVQIVFRERVMADGSTSYRAPRSVEEYRRIPVHPSERGDGTDARRLAQERDRYDRIRAPDVRTLRREPRLVTTARRGFVLPYPITRSNVISTFGDCRPGGRTHAGIDIAGVGPDSGLGTPVYSMARARVTFIGLPQHEPAKFGTPDKRRGTTPRGPRQHELPRSQRLPVYGPVFYFTRDYGSWRSGTIIYTEVLDGPLAGHTIRYMHLGAIHPELSRGSVVEAGQEIGLMGGTAVMHDSPHMHIDIENAEGERLDVAPFLGLPADPTRCRD